MTDLIVPDYAKTDEKPGIVGTACLQYTHNGLDGNFYLGTQSLGKQLLIRPFEWRWANGERWGRKNQNWLDLAFLNESNCLSVISAKKQSATNLYSAIVDLKTKGIVLEATWMLLVSELVEVSVINDNQRFDDAYSAVKVGEFGFVSEEQLQALYDWYELIDGEFDWNIVGEVD